MMAHSEGLLLVKNLLIFLFGILVWICPLSTCRCLNLRFLNLRGMQASQVSTWEHHGVNLVADLAIDGNTTTLVKAFSCSHTKNDDHPWWKVDLGTHHCLGRVTLVNREGMFYQRYNGTIVRAGNESDIFKNAACGLPVTMEQASIPGAHIPIVCDPPVIARYVSVDDDEFGELPKDSLTLCEVMVEEYPMDVCLQTTSAMAMNPSFTFAGIMSILLFEGKCIGESRPLSVVHVKSVTQCFVSCIMSNTCCSFDYVTTSSQCRLYAVEAEDLEADDQPGCLVYDVARR